MLEDAERQVAAAEDSRNTLEATFLQAASTLENLESDQSVSMDWNAGSDSEKIAALFDSTLALIVSARQVAQGPGQFLPGRRHRGQW